VDGTLSSLKREGAWELDPERTAWARDRCWGRRVSGRAIGGGRTSREARRGGCRGVRISPEARPEATRGAARGDRVGVFVDAPRQRHLKMHEGRLAAEER
jgi:hypothetical protein